MPTFISKSATPKNAVSWTETDVPSTRLLLEALNSFYCGDSIRMTYGDKTFNGEADTGPAHDWIRSIVDE